jgi:membrane protein required for colicin V production
MNTVDWIILILLSIGLIMGFVRGVIRQVFSLGGVIVGIICGAMLYMPAADFLENTLKMTHNVAQALSFIVILIIVPMFFGLMGKLLSKLVHAADLGFIDRLLGAVVGAFKWFLLIGLVIQFMDMTKMSDKILDKREKENSGIYPVVRNASGFCLGWIWTKVKKNTEIENLISPEKKQDKFEDPTSNI